MSHAKHRKGCVRIRIEGKTAHQIHRAAETMNVSIQTIEKKKDTRRYRYCGYGDSINRFPEASAIRESEEE